MTIFESGYAIVIGVGADLPNTIDDAQGFADILTDKERCAYLSNHTHLLTGPKATRVAVMTALDELAQVTNSQSTVIIYFSGHGYRVSSSFSDAYFLMPYGYDVNRLKQTAISGAEFTNKLRTIPAKKLLVLLDCCHAGGVAEAKTPGIETMSKAPLPLEVAALLSEGDGRVLIASSKEDELSYAGKPFSAFTLALIESLAGDGVAKKDGYVRVADIALHAREVVPSRTSNRQHPVLHFEQADNFVLAYYAGGDHAPKGLPFDIEPKIEPEPGAWMSSDDAGDVVDFRYSQGAIYKPEGAVNQHFGDNTRITGDGNVIGNNNRVTINKADTLDVTLEAFQRLLQEFKAAIRDSNLDADTRSVVENDLQAVSEQTTRDKPNKVFILTRLNGILAALATADGVLGLADRVQLIAEKVVEWAQTLYN